MPKTKSSQRSDHDPRFWYRYVVPLHQVSRAIVELTSMYDAGRIHGVLLFVYHAEERGAGLTTLEEIRGWLAEIQPLLKVLRDRKIPWGFNVWQTIGFSRFAGPPAPNMRRAVPFQPMVGHDGAVVEEWACPLDPRFAKHVIDSYGLLAAEKPESLWIDDDFRYFGRNPAPMICFCPLHLKEMQGRTGRRYTRESLVKAIGDPYAEDGRIRRAWLKVQYESLADIAEGIQKRSAKVSPRTRVSLMTGSIEHRFLDGWEWPDLIKRLWPKGGIRIRPGFGYYQGGDPRPYLFGTVYSRQQQALLPKTADLWPEIENYPGGHFVRSARTIQMQLLNAAFFGMGRDVTLSIGGFMGQPIDEVDPIFEAIEAVTPMLAALNAAVEEHPDEDGLRLIMSDKIAHHSDWSAEPIWQWPHHRPWDYVMPPMGFPVTFKPRGRAVSVATGAAMARALGPHRIAELIREGLYCDGSFAAAMSEMDGLPIRPRVEDDTTIAAMEEVTDGAFGRLGDCISLRMTPKLYRLVPGDDAKSGLAVSWCLDHASQRVTPGTVLYDAGEAGRLAVVALEGQLLTDLWTFYRTAARKRQLEAVMNWLGRVPAFVREHPDVYPLVRVGKRGRLIGMTNLRDDPWKRVEIDLAVDGRVPKKAAVLEMNGRWRPVRMKSEAIAEGRVRVTLPVIPGVAATAPMGVWRVEA